MRKKLRSYTDFSVSDLTLTTLRTDLQFVKVLPHVLRFATDANVPVSQCVSEVAACITNPSFYGKLGMKGDEEFGEVVAYVCGYALSTTEFIITQAYSTHPLSSLPLYTSFEEDLRKRGYTKLLMHTSHPPRLFSRYGFKIEKWLMTKTIT